MAYPCRIIPRNVFDLATLTSTIAPYSTTPLANLQNPRRARICRWPAASGTQSIKGEWGGTGKVVGGVSLDRFNLEPSALVRFRGFSAVAQGGSTLIDTGSVAPYNAAALGSFTWGVDPLGSGIFDSYQGYKYWVAWFAKATIASFQIDITDTTNSWQVIDLSRAIVGDYIETASNVESGLGSGWKTKTEQEQNDGGSTFSNRRIPTRAIRGNFKVLSPTERTAMYDFTRYVDKGKAFLITFQSSEGASLERDFTIPQAKFIDLPDLSWAQEFVHTMPFTLIEA